MYDIWIPGISLCSLQPARVLLTDMPDVVPLISANILLNSVMAMQLQQGQLVRQQQQLGKERSASLRERYRAAAYSWGTALEVAEAAEESPPGPKHCPQSPYFDVVLASDVVYYPEGYQPLIATLCDLLLATDDSCGAQQEQASTTLSESASAPPLANVPVPVPVCILAHRHRHPEDVNFFAALRAVDRLQVQQLDFKVRNSSSLQSDTHSTDKERDSEALKDVILFRIQRKSP